MRSFSFFFIALLFLALSGNAQVRADMRPCVFYAGEEGPFLEVNLTVLGASVSKQLVDAKWQSSVLVTTRIFRDSILVKSERYNLHGPFFSDSAKAPSFIDCHRYSLSNGRYSLEVTLKDFNAGSHALTVKSDVDIHFEKGKLGSSSLQPIEKYSKAVVTGPLTKSGFDLVPYNSDYFPHEVAKIALYWEVYNSPDALGVNQPLVLEWYLETAADSVRLPSYGAYSKQITSPVNVLLAKVDVSTLGSGEYALVALLKDKNNAVRQQRKYYFTRRNLSVEVAALQAMSATDRINAFTYGVENADTLKMFVECLWPIADNADKEKIVNETVKKDRESLKLYLADFWQRRAADTGNAVKMWTRYFQTVAQVNSTFKCGKQKGYFTDRGRVFLQYGSPNSRTEQVNEPNTYPYEIWHYYRITDQATGNFFSNRKFVFVNKNLGDYCYELVHSDMRGELSNPRWQYEVTRKNFNGMSNLDAEGPEAALESQYREIYQNPR